MLRNERALLYVVVGIGFMAAGIMLGDLYQKYSLLSRHSKAMGDLTLTLAEANRRLWDMRPTGFEL